MVGITKRLSSYLIDLYIVKPEPINDSKETDKSSKVAIVTPENEDFFRSKKLTVEDLKIKSYFARERNHFI